MSASPLLSAATEGYQPLRVHVRTPRPGFGTPVEDVGLHDAVLHRVLVATGDHLRLLGRSGRPRIRRFSAAGGSLAVARAS